MTQSVFITGAATGIGAACAARMAKRGWRVLAGVLDAEQAGEVERSMNGRATPIEIDVTREDSIATASERVASLLGSDGLDGLVNNAGISVLGPMEFVPIEQVRLQMEVNYVGQVAVTQAFLSRIRQTKGRIVNIASVAGRLSTPLLGPYNASKHAMEAFSDTLRLELAPWGIHVVCIEPAIIRTPMLAKGGKVVDAARRALPEAGEELYRPLFEAFGKSYGRTQAIASEPDVVAQAVEEGLTAARPRSRYCIGAHHRRIKFLTWLPDRLRDWFIHRDMVT